MDNKSLEVYHVLSLIVRDLLCLSPTMRAEITKSIGAEKVGEYITSLKEILTIEPRSERAEKSAKQYRYEGLEALDRDLKPKGKDDNETIAANNARRLGDCGEVVMLTGFKGDECVLEIYYDYTLQDVLQPVIESETGRLLGFSKAAYDKLCGSARIRNNMQTWIENGGQTMWESKHRFEVNPCYLQANPKYEFADPVLWEKLKARYYAIHPIKQAEQAEQTDQTDQTDQTVQIAE